MLAAGNNFPAASFFYYPALLSFGLPNQHVRLVRIGVILPALVSIKAFILHFPHSPPDRGPVFGEKTLKTAKTIGL